MKIHETAWPRVPLGDVSVINPRRPVLKRPSDAPTAFVPMSAVDESNGTIREYALRRYAEISKGYTYFEEGDILFAKITPCMQNGKHAIIHGIPGGFGFGSTEFHVIRSSDRVDANYLSHFLRQPSTLSGAAAHFQGAVGQQRVPPGYIRSLAVPLPPVTEQKRIAAKLDEQMATLTGAQAALAAEREAATALLSAVPRATLDPTTHPDWPMVRVGEIYSQISIGRTPSRGVAEYFRGPFPWVSIADRNNTDFITDTHEHLSAGGIAHSNMKVVRAGSLLFSFKLTVGKVAFAGVDLFTNEAIASFAPLPDIDLRYLRYALPLSAATTTDSNTFGAHMLNKGKIANLAIPLPALPQQHWIAEYLDGGTKQVDSMVASLDSEATALNVLRASLLDAAFSGQV
jgi:type I restriction enzyme S subunit